jgi:hypothetical protein
MVFDYIGRIDKKFKAYRNINLGIVTICDHCEYVVEDVLGGSQVHNNYIVSTCFECGDKVTSPASGEHNSEPAVLMAKLAKLENTQRIRRIDSRHVPPNRSLSSQRYQLGDAAATAPHVLNRDIRSPKVSTSNCDISRSATPTLSTKSDTACLQVGHMGHSMFAIRTLVSKVTNE